MFMPSGVVAASAGGQQYVVEADTDTFNIGYSRLLTFGDLVPDVVLDKNGAEINGVSSRNSSLLFSFVLTGAHADDDAEWSRVQLSGLFVGGQATQNYRRAERDNFASGANTSWQFNIVNADEMISGNDYQLVIV